MSAKNLLIIRKSYIIRGNTIKIKVGNTPLVELTSFKKKYDLKANNASELNHIIQPDQLKTISLRMIKNAIDRDPLKEGGTISGVLNI